MSLSRHRIQNIPHPEIGLSKPAMVYKYNDCPECACPCCTSAAYDKTQKLISDSYLKSCKIPASLDSYHRYSVENMGKNQHIYHSGIVTQPLLISYFSYYSGRAGFWNMQ